MKANRRLWGALLVATVVGVASLTALVPATAAAVDGVTAQEASAVLNSAIWQRASGTTVRSTLSAAEIEGLLYMREEEKLARDVYQVLYGQWGLPIFENIAGSEQTHMDAVKTLLDRYGLADPAADTEAGEFANAELQALYDELVAQGLRSQEEALRVGAAIEEIDILDLEKRLAETDQADIRRVYENLARGSRNHLRAFVRTLLSEEGVIYQPQYLSQEAYDAIISTPRELGGGRRGDREQWAKPTTAPGQ